MAPPALRFADRLDGFAFVTGAGGSFYATHDGGMSWRRLALRTVLAFATGGGNAYLVTARCTIAGCSGYRFERASVASSLWTAIRLPFAPDGSVLDLQARGSRVWLLGTPAGGGGGPSDALARSTDGGRTFHTFRGPCYPGLGGELAPASGDAVWAVCPTGMLAGALRSIDGGITFRSLKTPPLVNSAQLAPASRTAAVLAGNGAGSRFVLTTDGGQSWKRVRTPEQATFVIWAGFTDARVGGALVQRPSGATALWRTTDGGAHWSTVRLG